MQVKQSAMELTNNHAIVTLPVDELKDTNKAVLYWFAYTTPKINPLITKAVEEIFAQQALAKPVCCFTTPTTQACMEQHEGAGAVLSKTSSCWRRCSGASSSAV